MRYLKLAAIIALALSLLTAAVPAHAAVAIRQDDIAGVYESDSVMASVYGNGVTVVNWYNAYGDHAASYVAVDRLVGNGIYSMAQYPDRRSGVFLDGAPALGIKAAERGYVQLATYAVADGGSDSVIHVWRLYKTR